MKRNGSDSLASGMVNAMNVNAMNSKEYRSLFKKASLDHNHAEDDVCDACDSNSADGFGQKDVDTDLFKGMQDAWKKTEDAEKKKGPKPDSGKADDGFGQKDVDADLFKGMQDAWKKVEDVQKKRDEAKKGDTNKASDKNLRFRASLGLDGWDGDSSGSTNLEINTNDLDSFKKELDDAFEKLKETVCDEDEQDLRTKAAFNVAIDSLLSASAAFDAVGMTKSAALSLRLAAKTVDMKKQKGKKEEKKEDKKTSKKPVDKKQDLKNLLKSKDKKKK